MENRNPYIRLWQELAAEKSMVFLAGPRQAGKTTLAQIISQSYVNNLYFNWDIPSNRATLLKNPIFFEELKRKDRSIPLVVLDEIHKYKDWKNYLKGVFDQFHGQYQFLISGSRQLDLYQKGGDSLAGRYYLFHLWPFTIAESQGRSRTLEAFWKNPLKSDGGRTDLQKWTDFQI
jgi:predicted AAA+ superfamily ATPase